MPLKGPAPHTAEQASGSELLRASVRLLISLVILGLLVIPLFRANALGETTRVGLLAWFLVGVALYWLYAGLGYRPLLLLQIGLFSVAATLLSAKAFLVAIEIKRLSILRRTALALIIIGATLACANLIIMLVNLVRRRRLEREAA